MGLPDSVVLRGRQERVRATMQGKGLASLLVTSLVNLRYLTNHVGSAGILVLGTDRSQLLIDGRYSEAVRRLQASPAACPGLEVVVVAGGYEVAVADELTHLDGDVGFEAQHVTVSQHARWQHVLGRVDRAPALRGTEGLVERERLIKDLQELRCLRESAAKLSDVATAAVRAVRVGVVERDVAAVIDSALHNAGFERPAFDTIVASGPNSALPHHRPGDRTIATGDLVVLDFGGVLDGYCSDLTRTVAVGPVSTARSRLYEAVRAAQAAAIEAVGPGVLASAVDEAARNVLTRYGLGDAFSHGTGHGLGLEVHEAPRLGALSSGVTDEVLQPGMVFTIEPGAYVADLGGVRIEDDVVVTDTGSDVLTKVPRELVTLE